MHVAKPIACSLKPVCCGFSTLFGHIKEAGIAIAPFFLHKQLIVVSLPNSALVCAHHVQYGEPVGL
jgi:hypothetical protein